MAGRAWTYEEVLVAFNIYCTTPFGRLHGRNPEIIRVAEALGRTPGALAMKCCNLAAFDPALRARGIRGLSKASKTDRAVWGAFERDPEAIGFESETQYASVLGRHHRAPKAIEWQSIDGSDKEAARKNRVNQHLFRTIILTGYRSMCAICGLPIAQLLVASHIVPWALDPANRMNPRNGICLCSLHDRAFDTGIIHIDPSCTVRLASELDEYRPNESVRLFLTHYEDRSIRLPERWHPDPALLATRRELRAKAAPGRTDDGGMPRGRRTLRG